MFEKTNLKSHLQHFEKGPVGDCGGVVVVRRVRKEAAAVADAQLPCRLLSLHVQRDRVYLRASAGLESSQNQKGGDADSGLSNSISNPPHHSSIFGAV